MTFKHTAHPLWRRWCVFRNFYNNPKNHNYKYYAGRGLTYSKSFDDFEHFIEYIESTIGPLPFPGAILDRKNNDRGHKKGNLYWNTMKGNSHNRQSNYKLTYLGQTKPICEWATDYGINSHTLWSRIHDRGMTLKQALTK